MWLESDVGWGCAHQKAYLRLENLIWRWVSHVAVDRRLGSILCGPSHGWLECPYNMAGSFPQNEWWEREREREESFHAWYNLLTHCEFSILYLLKVSPWGFPYGLVVGTLFSILGGCMGSLVGELGSHMPLTAWPKKDINNDWRKKKSLSPTPVHAPSREVRGTK